MLSRVQYWVLLATAAVLLVVTGIDVAVYVSNVAVQKEFSSNNQYLQQTVQRQSLYQEIVRAMADLAASRNDEQLKELLAKHGVNVPSQPAAASAAPAKPASQASAGAAAPTKPKGAR
jgi:ribosomal protein L12E/L44/L45/RPP1/RPP2